MGSVWSRVVSHRFFATAAKGTEGALRAELRELGLRGVRGDRGGVHFTGELIDGARACLWSRIAVRVLVELGEGPARDARELYDTVRQIDWSPWITQKNTLAVRATGRGEGLNHTGFIALKVKDAVVDEVRDATGARPNVDVRDPDVGVQVHVDRGAVRVMLDLAGEPLHRRGFRRSVVDAVMKETLAAAVLKIVGWEPSRGLCDPMCGAGTFVLEAAMMAKQMAPGLRRGFAFERWPLFEGEVLGGRWATMREEARGLERSRISEEIEASDHDPEAVAATVANLRAAGLEGSVRVSQRDVRAMGRDPRRGWVVTDPPYGERTSQKYLQREGFYRQLGECLRRARGTVAMVAADPELRLAIGVKPEVEHTVWNGDIECRAFRWSL